MAKVFQRKDRGSTWYYTFRYSGRRYKGACPPEITKADAEQFMAKKQREASRADIYEKPRTPVPFSDFAADFLKTDSPGKRSKDRDKGVIEMLKVEWPGLTVAQVTPKMIEDYKAKRMLTRSPATVARELTIIKRMFRKAVEWGRVAHSPAATVQKPRVSNQRVRHLEVAELKRLLDALPDDVLRLALFARYTGARQGEILKLTWNDIDMKRGTLTFRDTKNGDTITAPMNATTKALLETLPTPINRAVPVFGIEAGAAAKVRIGRAWRDACATAKIADFHFHDLRHQAATDLLTLGANLNDVRDFLRHKSMAMTLRYAHLVDDRRATTARLLDALPNVGPKTAPRESSRL